MIDDGEQYLGDIRAERERCAAILDEDAEGHEATAAHHRDGGYDEMARTEADLAHHARKLAAKLRGKR